jgi:hypothetical protein
MSTLTYVYPGSGTIPATAAQAAAASVQVANVQFADSDTTVTIVHNWALDTLALARGLPFSVVEITTGETLAVALQVAKATNQIVVTKLATSAGTGGTFQFTLNRPHSILMPNT